MRWTRQNETVCMKGTVTCANAEDDAEAQYIVTMHNADIAALEAERDRIKNNLAVSRKQADKFLAIIDLDPDTQQSRAERAEAERDELRRRLDAILDRLPEGGVWCYTCNRASVPVTEQEPYEHIPREYNQMKTIFLCPICRRGGYAKDSCVSTLRAIAEGRTE